MHRRTINPQLAAAHAAPGTSTAHHTRHTRSPKLPQYLTYRTIPTRVIVHNAEHPITYMNLARPEGNRPWITTLSQPTHQASLTRAKKRRSNLLAACSISWSISPAPRMAWCSPSLPAASNSRKAACTGLTDRGFVEFAPRGRTYS